MLCISSRLHDPPEAPHTHTACSKWPVQEGVANVFLFESLLNLDNNMSADRHTVRLKEHRIAAADSPCGMCRVTTTGPYLRPYVMTFCNVEISFAVGCNEQHILLSIKYLEYQKTVKNVQLSFFQNQSKTQRYPVHTKQGKVEYLHIREAESRSIDYQKQKTFESQRKNDLVYFVTLI